MKSVRIAAAAAVAALCASAAEYAPAQWNLDARRDFAERRFGIFIHWGIYANYAQGEWFLENGGLDEPTYSQMMYGFYPSRFDAREWVRTFKDAGARYMTITSRHHDGFSLWPSKADDGYNIGSTPFKRDILGELAEACRAEGIQLNFYYSLMDWHRPDYPTGREVKARSTLRERKEDYRSYKKFMLAQLAELLDRYHPGYIWFDGEWDHDPNDSKSPPGTPYLDWEYDEIYDLLHAHHTLVANNNHKALRPKEDIGIFERDLPGENKTGFSGRQEVDLSRPLEQADVIQENVWGYRIAERNFRTPEQVVAMLARAAAKNSNLNMNIGPQGDGRLPDRAVEVLKGVGVWMRANGESIYGTTAGPLAMGDKVVSTRKGDVLYLHFLDPEVKEFEIPAAGVAVGAVSGGAAVAEAAGGRTVVKVERAPGNGFDLVVRVTGAL